VLRRQVLDLSGAGLTSLSALCGLPKLTELYLRDNGLACEALRALPAKAPLLEMLVRGPEPQRA
jgi:hypothetical protein